MGIMLIGSTFAEGDNDTEPIDPGTAASYMSEARSARRHRFDWSAGPAVAPVRRRNIQHESFVALWKCAAGVEACIDFKRFSKKKKKANYSPRKFTPGV